MHTFTKSGALKFIQYAIDKGLVKSSTGVGWRSAFGRIFEDLAADGSLDDVDISSEVLRYNNRHPGVLSPDSLKQYEKRVIYVTQEFRKYLENPTGYKGVQGRPQSVSKVSAKKTVSDVKQIATPHASPTATEIVATKQITSAVTETSLMMPFPLRPSFLAQIIIPRDLSKDEANRLCNFIQALAHEPTTI